jgi:hypothetical protein
MLRRGDLQYDASVFAASGRFRQGSIVRDLDVAFTSQIPYCITPAAREQVTAENNLVRVHLAIAIVTSQTCDLQNPKRIGIRPLVTVARVFDATTEFDDGFVGHIVRGRIGDLIPLTASQFTENGVWVADLRVEGAIERSVLVGKEPEDGFSDDEGYFRFQRSISEIRGRNAVDDRVLASILTPLRDWLESDPERSDLIEEIRIRCLPTILQADSAELYFLVYDDTDPATVQTEASELYATITAGLPDDLSLIDISVLPTSTFSRADEIGTERLDLDDLSES